jgi:serine/threonine protein kinase
LYLGGEICSSEENRVAISGLLVRGCDARYLTITCDVEYENEKFTIKQYKLCTKKLDLSDWSDVIYAYTATIEGVENIHNIYNVLQKEKTKRYLPTRYDRSSSIFSAIVASDAPVGENDVMFDVDVHIKYQESLRAAITTTMIDFRINYVHGEEKKGLLEDDISTWPRIFKTNKEIILKVFSTRTRGAREIDALQALRDGSTQHKNTHVNHVILLKGVYQPSGDGRQVIALPRLSPISELRTSLGLSVTPRIKKAIKDVLCGIHYIHQCGYLHLDIKESNLLEDSHNNVIVCDFDVAEKAQELPNTKKRIGTEDWWAPESKKNGTYSQKSDMYSAGLVFAVWTLHNGMSALDANFDSLLYKQESPLYLFLRKLLHKDPNQRYSAQEALQDPFLN